MPTSPSFLTRMFRSLGIQTATAQPDLGTFRQNPIFETKAVTVVHLPDKDRSPRTCLTRDPLAIAISPNPQLYSRQSSALLFTGLPVELRDLIWEGVLGGNTIHMYWKDRDTLRGFICSKQASCISISHSGKPASQRLFKWGSANDIQEKDINPEKGFMDLLLVCRAV
jgi:hypothetical protein